MKVWGSVLLVAALGGCANTQAIQDNRGDIDSLRMEVGSLEARVHALTKRPAVAAPVEHYCYINGQQFSKGTIISGRICEAQPGGDGQLEWRYHD